MATAGDTPPTSLPFPRRDVSSNAEPNNIRQATLVLPETGERVRRNFTLRDPKIWISNPPNDAAINGNGSASASKPQRLPLSTRFVQATKNAGKSVGDFLVDFCMSRAGQGVFKCSLAYFVATMAVFLPFFSTLLGSGDGKHLVANIVVWFHPARSSGNMDYSVLLAFAAFVYGAFVAYCSMGIATITRLHGVLHVGQIIILVFCCGFGMGFLAWYKQLMNDPVINVACSVAAIPIVTILTKDRATLYGYLSHTTLRQVLAMMIMAFIIVTIVNLVVLPVSGRRDLRDNLFKATNAYATMLAGITSSFLSGSEEDSIHPALAAASDKFKTAFGALDQNLIDSRKENYVRGTEKLYWIEKRLVTSMQRLSQDIGGLRSALSIQFWLLSEGLQKDQQAKKDPASKSPSEPTTGTLPETEVVVRDFAHAANGGVDASTADAVLSASDYRPLDSNHKDFSLLKPDGPSAATAGHVFATFIDELGPPMKSLAFTLQTILTDLPLGQATGYASTLHPNFRSSLYDAIEMFSQARKQALETVYHSKESTAAKSEAVAADFEEVAASCGHFSSSLQDLAENVVTYLDTVRDLEQETQKGIWNMSWNWLCFWRRRRIELTDHEAVPPATAHQDVDFPLGLPALATRRFYQYTANVEKPALTKTLRYRLWQDYKILCRDDVRFAIKVGAGGALLASLAYMPVTQATFHEWRLEWSLATYMFVCAMNIGSSNAALWPRIRGTCYGAVLAIIVWIVARGNPFALAFLCWAVAFGSFYVMLVWNQAPMARFCLLTFNLSVLYSYSLSINDRDDDDPDGDEGGVDPEIFEIVFHRLIAVGMGIFLGMLVTQIIWPISARQKLKQDFALLWLRMGLIWKRGPLSVLVDEGNERLPAYMNITGETKLHQFADFLDTLRKASEAEFALRGPFMTDSYDVLLKSTVRMLDGFHALSVVTIKDSKASRGEQAILNYTTDEREQLAQRISHLFYVLAASIKIQYPLTETLPDIQHTRDRLLARIFQFRTDDSKRVQARDEDYEVLYSYILVTAQIAKEIDLCAKELEKLYGGLTEEIVSLH